MGTSTYTTAAIWLTVSAASALIAYVFGGNPLTLLAATGIGATACYLYR